MKKNKWRGLCRFLLLGLFVSSLPYAHVSAQNVQIGKSRNLARWEVPAGDYSGITPLGQGLYAVVSDKRNGFSLWRIRQDSLTGAVLHVEVVREVRLQSDSLLPPLDLEGISWWPERHCLLLASEQTQTVRCCDLQGREMPLRWTFSEEASPGQIHGNYGFESLTRDDANGCFWTCTENVLRSFGAPVGPKNPVPAELPLYCLSEDGSWCRMASYRTDAPVARSQGRAYCFGVSEMLALPGYGLLVLEREFFVSCYYGRSWVNHKLYRADTDSLLRGKRKTVDKALVASFRTRLNPFSYRLANYEGMCAGIRLADGRQTLLLVSDSQSGAGNRLFHLKDYLRVLVLPDKGTASADGRLTR